ncbi:MAG: hypothetical protein ACYTF1_01880 [Planctomycetota bacterium]|jgi:hypothetical protein
MIRPLVTILAILMLFLSLACQREKEPPPHMLTGQVGALPPIYLANDKPDSKIIGPAAEAGAVPETDQPDETAEEATDEPIDIDDSSPEAIVKTYVKMVSTQQFALWPDLVVPEQTELAGAFAAMTDTLKDLRLVMDDKFPGHAIKLPGSLNLQMPRITIVGVEAVNDREALATIKVEKSPKSAKMKVKLIDDGWRIVDPTFMMMIIQSGSNDRAVAMVEGQNDTLRGFITRVEDDEFSDTQEVANELVQLLIAKAKAMQTGGAGAAPDGSNKTEKPAKPKPQPKKSKPKSQLERQMEVAPGPGFLQRG